MTSTSSSKNSFHCGLFFAMCMSMTICSPLSWTVTGKCEACSTPPVPVTRTGKPFARMNSTTSARFSTRLYGGEYIPLFYERDGLRRDALDAADEAQVLRGRSLHVDRGGRDAEVLGDVADHARYVRRHARLLRDHGGVDIDNLESA